MDIFFAIVGGMIETASAIVAWSSWKRSRRPRSWHTAGTSLELFGCFLFLAALVLGACGVIAWLIFGET